MLQELDTIDWQCVFAFCGEDVSYVDSAIGSLVHPVLGLESGTRCYTREDVAKVLHRVDGENDGPNWWGVFEMKDGAFLFVSAGCDYTGWDCRAGGQAWWADTLKRLFQWGLGDAERIEVRHLMAKEDSQ